MAKGVHYNRLPQKRVQEARRDLVAKLLRKGYSFREIQKQIVKQFKSCSLQTVYKDAKALAAEWRLQRSYDLDAYMQLELDRNLILHREAWDAWVKSKTDYTTTHETTTLGAKIVRKKKSDEDPEMIINEEGDLVMNEGTGTEEVLSPQEVKKEVKQVRALGNPIFLAEMRQLAEQRIELLGLKPAQRVELTGGNGTPLFSQLSDDELEQKIKQIMLINTRNTKLLNE